MPKKILVVDDDPMTHRLLEFALKDEDYSIEPKLSGDEAKAYIKAHNDNLSTVILDWEMPGMSGLDLLAWLKADEELKELPVVMLTAHSGKEDLQKGIDAGAYYYLTKPFDKYLLRSVIRAAIEEHQAKENLRRLVKEAQNPFHNLVEGKFTLKTLDDAQRLSVYIANASEVPDQTLVICELLNNAVEHGNLGISYDDKSRLIDEDRLMNEINRRLKLPENKDKLAMVAIQHNGNHMNVLIEDQGDGFDYEKYLDFDENRVFDNHGRGIAMANSMLDIKYLGKGNRVAIEIPIPKANDN